MTLEWLEELEDRVREASDRLGVLREENRALTEKIAELEARLAAQPEGERKAAPAAAAVPVAPAAPAADTAKAAAALAAETAKAAAAVKALEDARAAWAAEREEIRGRVARMAQGLEKLVET